MPNCIFQIDDHGVPFLTHRLTGFDLVQHVVSVIPTAPYEISLLAAHLRFSVSASIFPLISTVFSLFLNMIGAV
jgi:hypothetical protein